jgi:glycosyltransferase involved in cell wall biosynthesis
VTGNKGNHTIALFLPALWGGGAERVFLNLAVGLAQKGFSVDLILAQAEGPYMEEVPHLPESIRLIVLNQRYHDSFRTLSSLPALIRYLRKEKPVALLSGLHANVIAVWATKLAQVPTRLVISEHNTFSYQNRLLPGAYSWLMMFLVRLFYPWADQIVAVSNGAAEDLAKIAKIPPAHIRTIYNPIITPDLREKAIASLDHPWFGLNTPPVMVSIGRLTKQKDFSTLIKAFSQVRQSIPARLIILGEGEERPALEALARQLCLEQDLSMPGFVPNPYPFLTRAAVFVLSSKWEGLPTVLVEALYCGVPVIAMDCPSGPREILQGGKFGKLVPVGDTASLTQTILVTLSGKPNRPPHESWQEFELDTILNQYISVLLNS